MKVAIHRAWKNVTPALGEELMGFWRSNKAIADDSAAAARALQAVCIARDEAGAICGVGTAMVQVLPRLRQPMYYYRQFFAESMRGARQVIPFYQEARQVLQEYNKTLDKPESLGILIETETAKLSSANALAYKPAFAASFIGYSPHGTLIYASYFDGAVLQSPAPLHTSVPEPPATGASDAQSTTSSTSTTRRTSSRS